jgi:hypothetical protein
MRLPSVEPAAADAIQGAPIAEGSQAVHELVPDGFEVPARLEHERFRLRMLSIDDIVKYFDAIQSRVDRDRA